MKLTPRVWNPKVHYIRTLQHISWILHYDIKIIGFKRSRDFYKCSIHDTTCMLPYYIFQNTLLSCTKQCPTVVVVNYNSFFYLYSHNKLQPLLINLKPNSHITWMSVIITNEMIDNILNNKHNVALPFNVTLYSSYHYVRHQSTKLIQNNVIGTFIKQTNKDTIHIFVSPTLKKYEYFLNLLEFPNTQLFTKNTMCAIQHIPEGNTLFKKVNKSKIHKETLNQDNCICEHPSTQRVFLTSRKTFHALGMFIIKYCLLYYSCNIGIFLF